MSETRPIALLHLRTPLPQLQLLKDRFRDLEWMISPTANTERINGLLAQSPVLIISDRVAFSHAWVLIADMGIPVVLVCTSGSSSPLSRSVDHPLIKHVFLDAGDDDTRQSQVLTELLATALMDFPHDATSSGGCHLRSATLELFHAARRKLYVEDRPIDAYRAHLWAAYIRWIARSTEGDNLDVPAHQYQNYLEGFLAKSKPVSPVLAVADLSDHIEQFWLDEPDDMKQVGGVSERIFLISQEQFADFEVFSRFYLCLKFQADHSSEGSSIRFGMVMQDQSAGTTRHHFGEAGVGHHLIIADDTVTGGYIVKDDEVYLRFSRDSQILDLARKRFRNIEKMSWPFEREWDSAERFRREWIALARIGHWRWSPNVIQRNNDYFTYYDCHIRCWIPMYDKLIAMCAQAAFNEVSSRVQHPRALRGGETRVVRLLEVGFGTGSLTAPLAELIERYNPRSLTADLVGSTPHRVELTGIDISDKMTAIATARLCRELGRASASRLQRRSSPLSELPTWLSLSTRKAWRAIINIKQKFDVICGCLVLHDVADMYKGRMRDMLSDIDQILTPEGCVVFADCFIYRTPANEYSARFEWWKSHLTAAIGPEEADRFLAKNRDMAELSAGGDIGSAARELGFTEEYLEVPVDSSTTDSSPFAVMVLSKRVERFRADVALLSKLYEHPSRIRQLVAKAGLSLDVSRVNWQGAVRDVWFEVLAEAEKHRETSMLLDEVSKDYPAA